MKVLCTGNALSDIALTPIHRSWFETSFGPKVRPCWQATPGRSYTVYGISIRRGYPFYWVKRDSEHGPDWGFIPSICFTTTDARMSSFWRIDVRVIESCGAEVFSTRMYAPEFYVECFLENLVDGRLEEVAAMDRLAAEMDAEFIWPT